MIGLTMLAAMQGALPSPVIDLSRPPNYLNPQPLSERDYPALALKKGDYGIVSVVVRVSATGKAETCKVTGTSGSISLDRKTCSLLMGRGRFEPARAADGSAVAGDLWTATKWGIHPHWPGDTLAVRLEVARLPGDYRAPIKVRLVFDALGRVQSCYVRTSSGSRAADDAACAYARRELVAAPPKSGSPDVPAAAVRFMVAGLSVPAIVQ